MDILSCTIVHAATGLVLTAGANAGDQVTLSQPSDPAPDNQVWNISIGGYYASKANGLVLDVFGENTSPGTAVIVFTRKDGGWSNQMWSYDTLPGKFVSLINQVQPLRCLDFSGNNVVINPSDDSLFQRWMIFPA